jgi:hypothetical protein
MMSQPIGGHADTSQALIFKDVDTVAQGGNDWDLGRCGFFGLGTTELRNSANEREVGYVHCLRNKTKTCAIP